MIDSARRVLFPPSREAFERAAAQANLGRAILFAAGAGLLAGVSGATLNLFSAQGSAGDVVVFGMFNAIRFVGALLVTQAVIYGGARALGAPGAFESQTYLGSLFVVPLLFVGVIASGLNGIAPGSGYAVQGVLLLYQMALTVPMLRAAHGAAWRAPAWQLALVSVVGNAVGGIVSAVLPQ